MVPELEIPVTDEQEAEENVGFLEGMRCPKCESLGPFSISCSIGCTIYDNAVDQEGGAEWDDDSTCICNEPDCGFEGEVRDFREENQGGG